MFPKEVRMQVAPRLADREKENIEQGEYDVAKGTVSKRTIDPAVFVHGLTSIGHAQLINKVQSILNKRNGMGYIFHSPQNNKKDPSFKEKTIYISMQINDPNLYIGDAGVKTTIQALQKIQEQGRTRVIMIAESDRVVDSKIIKPIQW